MIDRAKFYDNIRDSLFGGHLTDSQVSGMNAILDEWDKRELSDLRWLAYMLSTVYHECALVINHVLVRTMQPVTEAGGEHYLKSKSYYPFIGRGFVQLTWSTNYSKFSKILGIDIYNHPEYALQTDIATKIMFEGMIKGLFTGKKLSDYFNTDREDYYNARRIINGIDKADLIKTYAEKFHTALSQ